MKFCAHRYLTYNPMNYGNLNMILLKEFNGQFGYHHASKHQYNVYDMLSEGPMQGEEILIVIYLGSNSS